LQGFDSRRDGRDHDFGAGGTVARSNRAPCSWKGLRFLARCVLRIRQKPLLKSSKGLNDKYGFVAGETAMNVPPAFSLFHFDFYEPLPIQVEVSDAPLTSDAGLLPLRQFDQRIGLTHQFAAALYDPRNPDLIDHTFPEMVRSRVFGILAGYEDQNDHDTLRTDPVFKLIADRSPEDAYLASQPTLSRFENQIDIASLKRLRQVFVDQFIASFAQPPLSLTFDLDAVDDPTYGSQQLSLFHGFYEQHQMHTLQTPT
jgi:hypothetical protein